MDYAIIRQKKTSFVLRIKCLPLFYHFSRFVKKTHHFFREEQMDTLHLKKLLAIAGAAALMLTGAMAAEPAFAAKTDKVIFAAGRPDDAWFALSHGLATMINERSEWLEAEVVATAGIGDATKLAQRDPEKRKNHIVITMTPGMELWATPEYTTKKIGSMGMLASALVTLDPKIKTWADLKGKTIALPRKVKQSYTYLYIDMLAQAGILDDQLSCFLQSN